MKVPDTPVIWASLLVALLLSVVTLPADAPQWLGWLRPHWVALFLFYWVLAVPHHVALGTAWVLGLLLDALHGTLIGQQALVLLLLAFFARSFYPRLRMYSLLQQSGIVLLLVALLEGVNTGLSALVREATVTPLMLLPALTSALLWAPIFLVLRALRRYFRIV